ncbi:MAG: helix-turn-helix transcriptional regulator [Bacteroidales bacterium]
MKKNSKKIVFRLEKTDTGLSAYSTEYPIYTTAETVPQLMEQASEAASLYFNREIEPSSELRFEIDLQQFFRYYRVLNARFLAEKIGMNPTLLSQYVQGKKKPSPTQTEKILNGIRQIGKELQELCLIPS